MTDEDLELLLFPAPRPASQSPQRPVPDWSYIDKELRRRNVTRRLLWEEYRAVNPDGFGYTWFCTTYEAWKGRVRPSMRQIHLGGEKVFVDFAGDTIDIVDPLTGEVQPMKLFVAAMGASNYTYAEACPSESLADWIRAHVNLFTFLSGTPTFVVCDNLKAAVSNPDRYDPGLNRTYAEMASHYGTAILAARPRRPKDKAKVEVAVQIAQRWILARLRNQRFFSRAELNAAIKTLVDELNARQMRGFGSSRAELFAELDKPKLTPLPDQPYAFARWKRCRLAPDYHVEVDGHWYSAPYRLIGELVDARIDDRTVEIFHKGQRIASHARAPNRRGHTTIADHMPSAHRRYGKWTPAAVIAAGERIGPSTAAFFQAVIDARPHPEQGFRTCLGILALVKSYGALTGMAKAFEEQRRSPDLEALPFEDRIGLLVDREAAERDTRRLTTRLKIAALRQTACVEDVDLRTPRGIDRAVFAKLVEGRWIDRHENLLVTGATGLGKSWLACALGHKACRDNRSVLYHRVPRLFEALALARGDGRYARLLKSLGRAQLLILDDWGLSVLTAAERRDLLEILEDRHGRASTIVTSQLPVDTWHGAIGDPTVADAILDRLVHNAHRLQLTGESMRKRSAKTITLDGQPEH
ncbi:transposase/DNA replication protein DnaC [Bradyrhizobium japonicum]|nr:transposase/DNA replication protein DnaC [Bradyrhizobium japonicum]